MMRSNAQKQVRCVEKISSWTADEELMQMELKGSGTRILLHGKLKKTLGQKVIKAKNKQRFEMQIALRQIR